MTPQQLRARAVKYAADRLEEGEDSQVIGRDLLNDPSYDGLFDIPDEDDRHQYLEDLITEAEIFNLDIQMDREGAAPSP